MCVPEAWRVAWGPLCVGVLITLAPLSALADESRVDERSVEERSAHFQTTYIAQTKPPFPALYSGRNSLRADRERSYTFSATAYLGLRPWSGAELYFNPEAVQGVALSSVTGLGGFTNGEMQKASGGELKLYRARLFIRQAWALGGGGERVESGANQLAGVTATERLVLTAGNLATNDIFGTGQYLGDARTKFLNWTFLTYGAYDYAADLRGYSWGGALEYVSGNYTWRAGRFLQPKQSNGQQLDPHIFRLHGDQVELERRHELLGRPGKLQWLAYRNVARMANFSDALAFGASAATTPDLEPVRKVQSKVGIGAGFEQGLTRDVGMFARYSRHDGKTETYSFTEIDESLSTGVLVKGASWGRSGDTVGLAGARNRLSRSHRDYLAAGGATFFLGDGRLNYRPESIFESFYNVTLGKATSVAVDWQRIANPGYNTDRGPVKVASVRLHLEF